MTSSGTIPPFYQEVYDIVCPNQENVDRDLFIQLLLKSSLPKQTIIQIWELVNTAQGQVTKNELYKALALAALAQQGKALSIRSLDSFSGQELPKPKLADLTDLKAASMQLRRQYSRNVLCHSYKDLCAIDTVKVELLPKKKGIILKHVEYEVTSQRHKTTILRRYSDFAALHELLTGRFLYRVIPRLPPKRVGASKEFIEQRRKCLQRYMNIVSRHPHLCDDKLLIFFLTFPGKDVKHKIREYFRNMPDEFMTSDDASRASNLVPRDAQQQLTSSKEHFKLIYDSLGMLQEITERMVSRLTSFSSDMLQMGQQFSNLSNDTTPLTSWTTGSNVSWPRLQNGFKHLSVELSSLADKSTKAAVDEEEGVVEKLTFYQDLITAYRDLCDRHEKGVLSDHHKSLQKLEQYKKKRNSGTTQGSEVANVDELENKMLEQEDQIASMENRNYYSLYCLQMETQFVHAHLDIFHEFVSFMANVESNLNSDLSRIWMFMAPVIAGLSSATFSQPTTPTPHLTTMGSPTSTSMFPGFGY